MGGGGNIPGGDGGGLEIGNRKKCTRASEDSERVLGLDLDINGHLKEGSSSQCARRVVRHEVEAVCMKLLSSTSLGLKER